MALKLLIRQGATFTANGTQVWYIGNNPKTLSTSPTLQAGRQWDSYPKYIDVTDYVTDLQNLDLTFTTNISRDGTTLGGDKTEQKKSASGQLQFESLAYELVKNWLIDDVSASLNLIDAKIIDEGCGVYEDFIIQSGDIEYCEPTIATSLCVFNVTLKQKDSPLTCLQNTLISDNWQGWFNEVPDNGKQHPRLSYCNEIRPNFQLCISWTFMVMFAFVMQLFLLILFPVVIVILGIMLVIGTVINGIITAINVIPGVNVPLLNLTGIQNAITNFTNLVFGGFLDNWAIAMVETAGCGREHPSVLVRDYITNVCGKCGISVDGITAPVFFATSISLETSDTTRGTSGYINVENPHYNVTALYAEVERGIRRYENVSLFGKSNKNTTQFFIPANAPIVTGAEFLNQLGTIYNTDWRVRYVNSNGQTIPYLYIQRKDWFLTQPGNYVYDFTANSPDRSKLVEGVCFQWNGEKNPAFVKGLYSSDAADTCGNEAKKYYNNNYSFADVSQNPNFDGSLDKTSIYFSPAKFRLDGASTDYIMDAYQVTGLVLNILPFIGNIIFSQMVDELEEFADYSLLMRDETCTLPKLIIWDGQSMLNAKAVKTYYSTAHQANSNGGLFPEPNTVYNNPSQTWPVRHRPETKVLANFLGFFISSGVYATQTFFNFGQTYVKPARLVNYPMYFDPYFRDTIWDLFHWIDDPVRNPKINMDWRLKIALCCDDLQLLGVFNNANDIKLLDKVKLPQKWQQDGIIKEIKVSYNPSNKEGAYIELSGTV